MKISDICPKICEKVGNGLVIPAHPLALDANRKLDERRQKALTRYYIDSGAGGIAVAVHTTQFEIRDSEHDLFRPVLEICSETADKYCESAGLEPIFKVAGICGKTKQAVSEAEFALDLGYHAGLLSLSAFAKSDIPEIVQHCRAVADVMPIFGFYLQPAVGGRVLPYEFWREFAEIDNVMGIKIAPFNRYQTLDVVRAVVDAGRCDDITLYTGNDDNIVIDLLSEFRVGSESAGKSIRIAGGLLGHWAVWTRKAVELLENCNALRSSSAPVGQDILTLAWQVTDSNAAFFDSANSFSGCIAGIHEVLRRQGLLEGIWCLNPNETISPGQSDEIDRVYRAYPHLNDDDFVAANIDKWLS